MWRIEQSLFKAALDMCCILTSTLHWKSSQSQQIFSTIGTRYFKICRETDHCKRDIKRFTLKLSKASKCSRDKNNTGPLLTPCPHPLGLLILESSLRVPGWWSPQWTLGPHHIIIIITLDSWHSVLQGSQHTFSPDIEFPFTSPEYGLSSSGLSLFAVPGERIAAIAAVWAVHGLWTKNSGF